MWSIRGLLHKTLTGEKSLVKSESSVKHNFTIDFTIAEMPLFRKFPEIRKYQIERKNFRKNEMVSR